MSRWLEEAKMTDLLPLASQRLKLVPILLFLRFEAVRLYQNLPWSQKPNLFDLFWSAGDAKRLQYLFVSL